MSPTRRYTFSALLGLVIAVALFKLAACSAIDPNPPDPHVEPPGEPLQHIPSDASDEEAGP